jgi:hypothetical protein
MTNSSFLEKRAESLEQKGGEKSVKNRIHFWASLATPNLGLPSSILIKKKTFLSHKQ